MYLCTVEKEQVSVNSKAKQKTYTTRLINPTTMLSKISKVGTSVGVIIPRYIATEGGFSKGQPVNIEFKNDRIVISKAKSKREGWASAFAKYAKEGEDATLLPDFLDSEAMELM